MIFSFFGFGRGKIKISIEKFNFSFGETIKGRVSLELKKPILAKQLKITLAGLKITTRREVTLRGRSTTRTSKDFIYCFDMPLDGEKEYLKEEYPFEIKIPVDIIQKDPEQEDALGAVSKTIKILSSINELTSRIEWYLEATLEIPKAFDIKNKVKINIE